ncbi:hypothetical protein [Porphyromonas sp.]|uniref:hypothetical protein n=1 Tax=Porphyromonas sp. TaxID=1924944 RepID=UPI0026DBD27A|nr:hypothetical protein [Porphyromonas sp.]MDO4771273.1 hypothetical protein [Porphyromonas sp.]
MRYIFFACILFILSCNRHEQDPTQEDYENLFPFTGIDKPESIKGDMVVRPCDPDLVLENYKYPGDEDATEEDEYEVTLTCEFNELDNAGGFVNKPSARYTVSYINEHKELVVIPCESAAPSDNNDTHHISPMRNGISKQIRYKVRSGFPMYLSVNGVGPRNSNIKASIKAVSTDGLVEIPALKTEQYQNEEGPNKLRNPYCEFIILP